MKLFASALFTETNTFSPIPTGKDDFDVIRATELTATSVNTRQDLCLDVIKFWQQKTADYGGEFIFGLSAFAQPAGLTVGSVYTRLRDEILTKLKASLPVDIVLLNLHGAMMAEAYDDVEGDILRCVRQLVGSEVIIGAEIDPHCHLTDQMLEQADLIVIYKEYPHTDIVKRAADLFELAVAAHQGRIKPMMAYFDCRMIGFYLTPFEPMRSFVDAMMAAEGQDGVLSLSLAHGFPCSDHPALGTKMLAVCDGSDEQAQAVATNYGRKFYELRDTVLATFLTLDEALDQALAGDQLPVVIADQADNAGGGAPGDSTFVLQALLEREVNDAALSMIWDPTVVQLAHAVGVGATLTVRLGGKMGIASGTPLDLTVTVKGLCKNMTQDWPQGEGKPIIIDCGDAAALSCKGIDIVVNSIRSQTFGTDVFYKLGIDPTNKRLLVVKSTQHFYAGFAPIAGDIIYMAGPGALVMRVSEVAYQRVDRQQYPWVKDPLSETARVQSCLPTKELK